MILALFDVEWMGNEIWRQHVKRHNISFELSLGDIETAEAIEKQFPEASAIEVSTVAQLNSSLTRDTGYHGQ